MLFSCQMKTDCRHSASSCLWGAKGPAMPPRWVWPRRRARPLDAAPGQRELGAGPRVRGERRPQVCAGRAGDRGRADRRVLGPRSGHGVIACSCHTPPETVFPRWDVKPQNLLTGNKGTVKVPDVGLARGVRWRPPGRGSPAAGSRSVGATSRELATKEPLSVGIRKLLRSSEFPERWPPHSEVWPGWNLHRTESTFPKWKPGAQRPGSETRATQDQIPRWKSSACRLLRAP